MKKLTWLLLPALLVPVPTALAQRDTIVKKDGSRLRGVKVLSMTLQSIRYERGGDELELPARNLASVEWFEPPESFVLAKSAMGRGDFETATQMFSEAATAATRAPLKVEALFLSYTAAVSASAADSGRASTAADKLQSLLTENPDHVYVPAMKLQLGRALRFAGRGADSEAELVDLDATALREGWGSIWSARAKLEIALAQLAQAKGAAARGSFRAASGAADSALNSARGADQAELGQIKRTALVGEGDSYIGDKNYSRAIEFFRNLANTAGKDDAVKAAAKAGEGEALYLQAIDAKRPDDLRKAQMALAEASILDNVGRETSAKANYFLGKTLLELGPDKEGDDYKSRAAAYFQIVLKSYSNSSWAALAKVEMTR